MYETCKNCKYHDDFSWVCFNGDSEYRADFTDEDFTCNAFEMNEDKYECSK